MGLRVILTGATGMVGEGVLHECLNDNAIDHILVIGRKPSGVSHPKISEIMHEDFFDLSPVAGALAGYDACFFCLGVSSIGLKEEAYKRLTYDLTMTMAGVLQKQDPHIIFCYVSGSGTDSTEKGRSMWARVKGMTENRLLQMFPGRAFMFRPGYMHPTPGLKNTLKLYRYFTWMYPFMRMVFPWFVSTLSELGKAMIHVAKNGYERPVLEVRDIVRAAGK